MEQHHDGEVVLNAAAAHALVHDSEKPFLRAKDRDLNRPPFLCESEMKCWRLKAGTAALKEYNDNVKRCAGSRIPKVKYVATRGACRFQ